MLVSDASAAKIGRAVEKCLNYVRPAENSRIRRILEFLHWLKSSPGWSEPDISEVTNRVLASLAQDAKAENPRTALRGLD